MYVAQPDAEPVRLLDTVSGQVTQGYHLRDPWSHEWRDRVGGTVLDFQLRVPVGFLWDGNSAPSIAACAGIQHDGLNRAAGLLHDAMYRAKGIWPAGWLFERLAAAATLGWAEAPGERRLYTRLEADSMYEFLLTLADEDRLKRRLAYRGIRMCGWVAWKRPAPSFVVVG